MSYMFEVFYKAPANPKRETALTERVATLGGRLTYREDPDGNGAQSVSLTYEFGSRDQAEAAATALREQGEHVEGPVDYGD